MVLSGALASRGAGIDPLLSSGYGPHSGHPGAIIGKFRRVKREGHRRLSTLSIRLTGDLGEVLWTWSGLPNLLFLLTYRPNRANWLISKTFRRHRATLFNDHDCGRPAFCRFKSELCFLHGVRMISLPDTVFIAFGVVAASIIAGVFSYINLVSVKESKVSEFRQDWINDLRKEISEYISAARALMERLRHDNYGQMIPKQVVMAKKNNHGDLYNQMLNSKVSILLRINDKEKKEKIKAMNNEFLSLVENIHNGFESAEFGNAEDKIETLISKSRELLKYEWNRARDGELGYRVTKFAALTTIGLSITFLVVVAILKISPLTPNDSEPTPLKETLEKIEQSVDKEHNNSLKPPAPQVGTPGKPGAP